MELINTKQDFSDLIQLLQRTSPPFIAVDTEFVRQRTYFPELCLIQLAFHEHCFVVDTLSLEVNAQSLISQLYQVDTTLVLHASKQDLEIFFHLQKSLPSHIFDTQIAATFAGLGESISYDNLVRHYLQSELNKTLQDTDWSKRPLSYDMIRYAASDVFYLRDLYPKLIHDLEKQDRLSWALDEMKLLTNPAIFSEITDSRLKRLDIPKSKFSLARAMFAFREEHAAKLNLNRSSIFPDKLVSMLCKLRDTQKMRDYIDKHAKYLREHELISPLIEVIEHAHDEFVPAAHQPMSRAQEQLLLKLRQIRDEKAELLNLPPSFLANNEDIKRFVMESDGRIAQTWRREVFNL